MSYKLLFITHSLENTGAPLVLLDAMRACKNYGHHVDVVSLEEGALRESIELLGISVTVAYDFLDNLPMWTRIFEKYDVVIVNTLACIEALYALNTTKVPTIWWIHEHEYWFKYYQQILPKPEQLRNNISVYGVSPITNDYITRYCGYETALLPFGLQDVREEYIIPDKRDDKVRFICPATYSHVKGQDLICAAVKLLPNEVQTRCEFIFCGATMETEMDYYQGLIEAADACESINIMGKLSHAETLKIMSECSGVIAASRLEPFSATVVEGMMLGIVPVASSACGVTYWLENGHNSLVFESENIQSLADAISKVVSMVLNRPDEYSEMAIRARKTYEDFFELSVFAERFLSEIDMKAQRK